MRGGPPTTRETTSSTCSPRRRISNPRSAASTEWRAEDPDRRLLDLLQTHSDHRLLDRERLEAVLTGIGNAIDAHGGSLTVNYVAVPRWAQRVRE